jgi:dipeptidyl aminopeptidase/acylaminoacyl peptidase
MSTIKVNALQDTSGNGYYPPRAWVNWNAVSTTSIRNDGNVSSITDYGTGHFGINLSSSLTDANFVFSGYFGGVYSSSDGSVRCLVEVSDTARTSSFIRFLTKAANSGSTGNEDSKYNSAQLTR